MEVIYCCCPVSVDVNSSVCLGLRCKLWADTVSSVCYDAGHRRRQSDITPDKSLTNDQPQVLILSLDSDAWVSASSNPRY